MMIRKFIKFISFSAILILGACQEINLKVADTDVPVIEGYITPGNEISVTISKQIVFSANDTNLYYLDSLEVFVYNGAQWIELENTDTGSYESSDFTIQEGDTLQLLFNYNDKNVTAETVIPDKPEDYTADAYSIEAWQFTPGSFSEDESITLSWSNPDTSYYLIVVVNIEDNPRLIDEDDEGDHPPRAFRSMPIQGDEAEINARDFTYYGYHQIILYKLNAEYAALYEQLGTSSLDITAPPSNIVNGLGIFTGLNADTLKIKVY